MINCIKMNILSHNFMIIFAVKRLNRVGYANTMKTVLDGGHEACH